MTSTKFHSNSRINQDVRQPIMAVKGPDRVRKRPAVIFGSSGVAGAIAACKMLLGIFITEATLGFSDGIEVKFHTNNYISIRSYDRGFLLDETVVEGVPVWQELLCQLYSGPRHPDETYYFQKHNSLYGSGPEPLVGCIPPSSDHCFDFCCVNYVCSFMQIESVRNGVKKKLNFQKGCVTQLEKGPTRESQSNTFLHFLLDAEIFDEIEIPNSEIQHFLQDAAGTMPGMRYMLSDERK